MKDRWYGDNRDLVKWTVLLTIARKHKVESILQVLYYSPTDWEPIEFDGEKVAVPADLLAHFRDATSICNLPGELRIETFTEPFANNSVERRDYTNSLIRTICAQKVSPFIVFLDPDTGLEPESGNFGSTHVSGSELNQVWDALRVGDFLVFYQHQDNKAGREWIERKRRQFANVIQTDLSLVKKAYAPCIANDVVFYFVQKN
jgi:hypothetical protein